MSRWRDSVIGCRRPFETTKKTQAADPSTRPKQQTQAPDPTSRPKHQTQPPPRCPCRSPGESAPLPCQCQGSDQCAAPKEEQRVPQIRVSDHRIVVVAALGMNPSGQNRGTNSRTHPSVHDQPDAPDPAHAAPEHPTGHATVLDSYGDQCGQDFYDGDSTESDTGCNWQIFQGLHGPLADSAEKPRAPQRLEQAEAFVDNPQNCSPQMSARLILIDRSNLISPTLTRIGKVTFTEGAAGTSTCRGANGNAVGSVESLT